MQDTAIDLAEFIQNIYETFPPLTRFSTPWEVTSQAAQLVREQIAQLDSHFDINGEVAIHRTATVEQGVIFKGPVIISEGCFIGAHTYFRDGVFLDKGVKIGPSGEVKSSFIFSQTALAHLNYVGNSLIGANVNLEAGSVVANHFNERTNKEIGVLINGQKIRTGVNKFGALIGDGSRMGANSVTSPGTILSPNTIVRRLQLIEQCPE